MYKGKWERVHEQQFKNADCKTFFSRVAPLINMIEVFICICTILLYHIQPAIFFFFFLFSLSFPLKSKPPFISMPQVPKLPSHPQTFRNLCLSKELLDLFFFLGGEGGGGTFQSIHLCVCVPRPIFAIGSLYESWARFFSRIGSGTAVWAN